MTGALRRARPWWPALCLLAGVGACGPIASEQERARGSADGGATPGVAGDAGGAAADGAPAAANPEDDGPPFIAFQRDFQGFQAWTRFDIPTTVAVGDGLIHPAGQRVVYINQMPAAGRTTFRNGTVIVKTMENGDTLASVKRGGGYNKNGARGWEWFELKFSDPEWLIVWRGITPPEGFCYGGIAGGACNLCHGAFVANDFVGTPGLDLSKLR
jgi:hypothetical protein